ncbi:MAG: hypothetical protein V3T18_01540 [Pseudomonadales bacterium]
MRLPLFALAAVLSLGCQTKAIELQYSDLTDKISNGDLVSVADLRETFLQRADLSDQLERLTDLEQQTMQLVEDEPLKLGAIGTAILDSYYGSLTGHYVLSLFYQHVDSPEAATPHLEWVDRIRADMHANGDGSRNKPYPAVTIVEAQMYAVSLAMSPVGSIYQTNEEIPFSVLIQAKPAGKPIKNLHFDLSGVFQAMRQDFSGTTSDTAKSPEFSPFSLIGFLAKRGDTAAQAAIGTFLASQNRVDDAVDWLRGASRKGNLLANSVLARIYWEKARASTDEAAKAAALDEVLENYLHAVALGSADAMYALGVLYLNGHYGEENKSSGVTLLKQAAEMSHSDSAMFLAHLHYAGEVVAKNLPTARDYYVQASQLDNPFAQRSYARFLLDREADQPADPRAIEWLKDLARRQDDAEAMLLLGNLHARGVGVKQSFRRAVGFFKDAVRVSPDDPAIVNEVAWTLTVSDLAGLKRARYALSIMEEMMTINDDARQRPEYLDTWAAACAANGDFDRAVAIQEEALAAATGQEFEGVQDVLQLHLKAFQDGQTITEVAP